MGVMDRHGRLVTQFGWQVSRSEAKAALTILNGLPVRADDWQPEIPYNREALALSWARIAGTGKDTKDVLLARQMDWAGRVYDSDGYTLKHAVMPEDPYTGEQIVFEQADKRAEFQVQLDHIVSIADAYRSGGHGWSVSGRNWPRLYNDDGNLLVSCV